MGWVDVAHDEEEVVRQGEMTGILFWVLALSSSVQSSRSVGLAPVPVPSTSVSASASIG